MKLMAWLKKLNKHLLIRDEGPLHSGTLTMESLYSHENLVDDFQEEREEDHHST
jgi:hypothetical protein